MPSEGQNSADLGKDYPPTEGIKTVKPDAAGFLYLPEDSVAANFAQDLPKAEARLIAATQGPIQSRAFGEPVSIAAWKTKPNYYIVAAKDRMIQPALQQAFARQIHAVTTVLQTSHVPMLSQPSQVAAAIIKAAETP